MFFDKAQKEYLSEANEIDDFITRVCSIRDEYFNKVHATAKKRIAIGALSSIADEFENDEYTVDLKDAETFKQMVEDLIKIIIE